MAAKPLSLALGVALAAVSATGVAAPGLTEADAHGYSQVLQVALSPDGKTVAYIQWVQRTAEEKNGAAWGRLWVVPAAGGTARPFVTGDVNVSAPAFSPDGRYIAFLMKRGDKKAKRQVWVIPIDGGEAQAATAAETNVASFAWRPDGEAIAYVAPEPPTKEEKRLKKEGYLPRVFEENLKDRALYVVPFAFGAASLAARKSGGEGNGADKDGAERLTAEGASVWQFVWAPDGKRLALGVSPEPLVDHHYMMQRIHLLTVAGKKMEKLVDNPGKLGPFRFSPDGSKLAYVAARSVDDHDASTAYVVDVGSGDISLQSPLDFEGHVGSVSWRDDDTLLVRARESVWTTLYERRVDAPPAARTLIYQAEKTGIVGGTPSCWPGQPTVAFVGSSAQFPGEAFTFTPGAEPVRLTDSNPWLAERALAPQKVVRYAARDGLTIEGILIEPLAKKARKKAPLLVDVHGGPESNVQNGWLTNYFHLGQVAAARGYAVFYPNYRGSTGRGYDFAMSSFADPAGKEFLDIADGIDHLVKIGVAHPDKVGLYGGSYGGYAAAWFGTYLTEKVKAVVSFVGVSDLVSKRFLTDIPIEDQLVHMGKPVREMWDLMRERSPITYAEKSRSAFLLVHGDADPRVHPTQSQEMYRALKRSGHPSARLVFYPGEGHGNRKRAGRVDIFARMMRWFDWYVRDGKPFDGAMPPNDLSDAYGLDDEDDE